MCCHLFFMRQQRLELAQARLDFTWLNHERRFTGRLANG